MTSRHGDGSSVAGDARLVAELASFYICTVKKYGGRNLLELGIRLERWLKQSIFGLLVGGASGQEVDPSSLDMSRCHRVLLVLVNFRMGTLLLDHPSFAALISG